MSPGFRDADGLGSLSRPMHSKFRPPPTPRTLAIGNRLKGRRGASTDSVEQPAALERATPDELRQAQLVGYFVARALAKSPSTPVRPPSHTCPPVRSLDFEMGITPTVDYTLLAPNAETVLLTRRLNPKWYGVILGFGWTVAFDSGAATGNPYLGCQVTLRINGQPHQEFVKVTRQLTSGIQQLNPVTIPIDTIANADGSLIELVFKSIDGVNTLRIDARLKGYQFPAAGPGEGIFGGLVEG